MGNIYGIHNDDDMYGVDIHKEYKKLQDNIDELTKIVKSADDIFMGFESYAVINLQKILEFKNALAEYNKARSKTNE